MTRLYVKTAGLSNAGMTHLSELKDLTLLRLLNSTEVTDSGIKQFTNNNKNLRNFFLLKPGSITGEGFKTLFENSPELTSLTLYNCSLSDPLLKAIGQSI